MEEHFVNVSEYYMTRIKTAPGLWGSKSLLQAVIQSNLQQHKVFIGKHLNFSKLQAEYKHLEGQREMIKLMNI